MNLIKTFFLNIFTWWKHRRTRTKIGIIAAIAIALFVILGKGGSNTTVVEAVKRQDLARTVSATGTVVSTTDLALSFQKSDIVKSVSAVVGQKVSKGQILATLDNASEAAAIESARGTLLAAQARYKKTQEGESDESIRAAEIDVENARRTLYSASLVADQDSGILADVDPTITGRYDGTQEGSYRLRFGNSLNQIKYSGLENGIIDLGKGVPQQLGTRGLYVTFPEGSYTFTDEWVIAIPNPKGAEYASNINAYQSAKAALAIKRASARSADLDAARADIVSAEGGLASAQAAFEKTIIRAPADGTVTKVDISVGDLAESFTPVITVQNIDNLYIEADVNESGVANLSVGQPVTVSYDALGKNTIFSATVSTIDLSPTVVDGIVNYKVKALITDATNIRPGMTANLSIETASAPNVLVIPDRTITKKNGVQTVEVLLDERKHTTETRTITTGLRGDGGLTEVQSGLSEGEHVVFNQK